MATLKKLLAPTDFSDLSSKECATRVKWPKTSARS